MSGKLVLAVDAGVFLKLGWLSRESIGETPGSRRIGWPGPGLILPQRRYRSQMYEGHVRPAISYENGSLEFASQGCLVRSYPPLYIQLRWMPGLLMDTAPAQPFFFSLFSSRPP